MEPDLEIDEAVRALSVSLGLLTRRLRQTKATGDLTLPETSALARLDRGGPMTSSDLAKLENISPQSMGATIGMLEARGYIERGPDSGDGRRLVITISEPGLQALTKGRSARIEALRGALATGFSRGELRELIHVAPLLTRLAECL